MDKNVTYTTEDVDWELYARLPLLLILGVPPQVVQTAPDRPHLKQGRIQDFF